MQDMELKRLAERLVNMVLEAKEFKSITFDSVSEVFVQDALRTEPGDLQYVDAMKRLNNNRAMRLLHVAMGLSTEAGEFIDALKKHIFYNKPLDPINLIEELGDTSWYMRVGCDALEVQFLDMLERNVAKLKARFPDKFTEEAANNRDLSKERETLDTSSFAATIKPHAFRSMAGGYIGCSVCGKPGSDSIHIIRKESL